MSMRLSTDAIGAGLSVSLSLATLALDHAYALAQVAAASSADEIPRMPDGRPDLNGFWKYTGKVRSKTDYADVKWPARDNTIQNYQKDFVVLERGNPNIPVYRPEYWEHVNDADWNGLTRDPLFMCKPEGLPRMGPPHKIVQTADELVFLYNQIPYDTYRIIPTDGRDFDPLQVADLTWRGYSVGHWEGDTLVITSVGFNDKSWLGWAGLIHSDQMRVTERVWRSGNVLHWQATVEDPVMLLEPWTMDPREHYFDTNPRPWLFETVDCEELDGERIKQIDPHGRGC